MVFDERTARMNCFTTKSQRTGRGQLHHEILQELIAVGSVVEDELGVFS